MTPATAAAVSLLERLRTRAEKWHLRVPPGLHDLSPVVHEEPGFTEAVLRLSRAGYYRAPDVEWIPRINAAIAALKGETT